MTEREFNKRMKEGTKIRSERKSWITDLANSDIDVESYEKETAGICSYCFARPGEVLISVQ
jgi:hypothetical protein